MHNGTVEELSYVYEPILLRHALPIVASTEANVEKVVPTR